MQFLVIAHDGKDDQAEGRRMAAREAHLALGDKMHDAGTLLYAAAILDDNGNMMIGSILICEFNSRAELNLWLKEEPYLTGNVWHEIEIHNCKVGPSFAHLTADVTNR